MKNSCEDIFLKTEAFHNKNSHIVHSCICIAPHPGLLFPFSPFLKAESYLRDLNGGRYTLPINNEEKQRKTWVIYQDKVCIDHADKRILFTGLYISFVDVMAIQHDNMNLKELVKAVINWK